MARAHSIWIVVDEDEKPIAAFTVKHEMLSWALRTNSITRNYVKLLDGQYIGSYDVRPLSELLIVLKSI
mgnify:CR=1 FL=1